MSVKETKLNNVQVEVLKAPVEFTKKNVLGWNYLQNPWSNVLFCSKKNSGKTTVIYNLVKNIIDKRTKVFIFSGSVYADSVYKELIKYCKNKEIPCKAYPHFIDNGINLIEQLVKGLGDTPVSDTMNKDEHASLIFDKDDDRPKRRKKQKIVPEILIICDDLGSSLRAQAISTLCKTNRHNKILNLFSFHVKSDILPSTCQQADFLFLFSGYPEEKLEELYLQLVLSVTFEQFKKLYLHATEKKYSFLYCDIRKNKYRKNFDTEIELQ